MEIQQIPYTNNPNRINPSNSNNISISIYNAVFIILPRVGVHYCDDPALNLNLETIVFPVELAH